MRNSPWPARGQPVSLTASRAQTGDLRVIKVRLKKVFFGGRGKGSDQQASPDAREIISGGEGLRLRVLTLPGLAGAFAGAGLSGLG